MGTCFRLPFCVSVCIALTLLSHDVSANERAGAVDERASDPAVESSPPPPETAKLVTEDAPPNDPGTTEIELTYLYGHARRFFNRSNHVVDRDGLHVEQIALTATRGLVEGLDARLSISWLDVLENDEKILGDDSGNVIFNFKWRLFESDDEAVSISWLPGFTAPFGESGGTGDVAAQGFWSVDQLAVATWVGERLNVSLDAGLSLPVGDDRDTNRGTVTGNAAVGYQVTSWLQPELELNYTHGFFTDGDIDLDTLTVTGGVILNLPRNVRVDLGVQQVVFGRNSPLATIALANVSLTF